MINYKLYGSSVQVKKDDSFKTMGRVEDNYS